MSKVLNVPGQCRYLNDFLFSFGLAGLKWISAISHKIYIIKPPRVVHPAGLSLLCKHSFKCSSFFIMCSPNPTDKCHRMQGSAWAALVWNDTLLVYCKWRLDNAEEDLPSPSSQISLELWISTFNFLPDIPTHFKTNVTQPWLLTSYSTLFPNSSSSFLLSLINGTSIHTSFASF